MSQCIPYVLEPNKHRLRFFYRRLNKIGLVMIVLIVTVNELFLRNNLLSYSASPEKFSSLVVLTLNASAPSSFAQKLIFVFPLLALCYAVLFTLLPKWGVQCLKRNLKTGLPVYEEYGNTYFFIDSQIQKIAFYLWHSVLMRVSFLFATFIPCMGINLFRSLV